MEFRILGPLEVVADGRPLNLGGRKQRALLGIFLLEADRVVPAERLLELAWPDEVPETASNVLQVHISQLRRVLEPGRLKKDPYSVLVSQAPGYRLRVQPETIDLFRFESMLARALAAAAAQDDAEVLAVLNQGLELWRGPLLTDLEDTPLLVRERARAEELKLQAQEVRFDAYLRLNRHDEVMAELEALAGEWPLRERLQAQLMLALYRSGRQAEASDVYQRTRRRLADELGMEPGPIVQRLLKQILNQDPTLNVSFRLLDADSRRCNLPAQLTKFVGRTREIHEVMNLLANFRLVTLTGAGGIGKTRLAIEVATELLDEYRDGVWLVDFALVNDPDLVAKTVIHTLGLRIQGGGSEAEILTNYLRGRQQLLLFDNCEHLIEPVAAVALTLLETCPDVRIFATSREPLGVSGESTWRVPSLSTPSLSSQQPVGLLREFEAISLFCECAHRALGTFTLTAANAPGVAAICHRLDGIPLAIELAASRLKLLSVNELNERLIDSLGLLKGSQRTAVPRHQTLLATIAWSYALLEPSEQIMFSRLSVFAGSFSVSAAEAIYIGDRSDANAFDLVARLVDKSLVLPITSVRSQGRLRLLEVLRQFACERLLGSDDAATIKDRHAEYFTALAEDCSHKLRGPEQAVGLDRLEVEHDNIRAALAWSLAKARGDLALRLIAAAWLFWYIRGYSAEGLRWAKETLTKFQWAHPLRGEALVGSAKLAWLERDVSTSHQLASEALAHFAHQQNPSGRGVALLCIANCDLSEGKLPDAERGLESALTFLRASDNHWAASIALNNLGVMAGIAGRYADAERHLSSSLELGMRIGDPWRKGMALGSLGELYVARGMTGRAAEVLLQLFVLQHDTHNIFSLSNDLETCSRLALALKQWEYCLRLAGAAESIRLQYASPQQPRPDTQKGLEEARRTLGPLVARGPHQQGLEMTTDEAIESAIGWLRDLTQSRERSNQRRQDLEPRR